MKSIVYYASRHGNTGLVAEAVADGLQFAGEVEVHPIADGPEAIGEDVDLVVVGGPTEGRHMTPQLLEFLERLPHLALGGRAAAAFDTRVHWPRWLSGSAADDIRRHLERMGAQVPVASESFIVNMEPEIGPEELERARRWGTSLVERVRGERTGAVAAT